MNNKATKKFYYFFFMFFLILILLLIEEKFVGSSGRSSLRLSFSPKSWDVIYGRLPRLITISLLVSVSVITYINYYQNKLKNKNIPEGYNLKDLLGLFFKKRDKKKDSNSKKHL